MMLNVLYQDSDYVAIDKPSGLLVHPTRLATEKLSAMAMLRDQLGQWVYPIHRLDRATSGVLIFGLSPEAASELSKLYLEKKIQKVYYGVARGYVPESGEIDKPLKKEKSDKTFEAFTKFKRIAKVELPHPVGKYPTARYSLVEIEILTGRLHQIRRHFSHIRHPLVGDTVYGDGRHNQFFRNHFNIFRLMLTARALKFIHPETQKQTEIIAPWPLEFAELKEKFFDTLS